MNSCGERLKNGIIDENPIFVLLLGMCPTLAVTTSAMNGTSSYDSDISTQEHTMKPLFDTIIKTIPAPIDNSDEPLQFQVAILDYNDFVGRIGIGRVFRGKIKVGDNVTLMKLDGSKKNFRVTKLFGYFGLKRNEIKEAKAGDIIAISGINDIYVGETIASAEHPEALPLLKIDPPTLQMDFVANDSPFAGREGDQVTPKKLEDRLIRQTRTDVSLKVEPTDQLNAWTVSGRGELHLSILVEELRREGFELQLSRPKVIYREIDGTMCEPFESVQVDTPDEYVGSVIDSLSQRKGEMQNMESTGNGQTRLEFLVPSRGLIGYNNEFMSQTGGYGIMNHTFAAYKPVVKNWNPGRRNGALVSINQGQSTTYSLQSVEQRGELWDALFQAFDELNITDMFQITANKLLGTVRFSRVIMALTPETRKYVLHMIGEILNAIRGNISLPFNETDFALYPKNNDSNKATIFFEFYDKTVPSLLPEEIKQRFKDDKEREQKNENK